MIFFFIIIGTNLALYLIGSIPFGLILTKLFTKQDIREIGSGNIGATNVLRTGNKKLAIATLVLDILKGAIPIYILVTFTLEANSGGPLPDNYPLIIGLFSGLLIIMGHCFPIWLKFKGGKGVATSLGVLLAAVPYAGLAALVAWIISALIFRISSLAALIAALVAPIAAFFIYGLEIAAWTALITLLIFIRHEDNIKRIIAGTEPKIGNKKENKS